VAPPAVPGQVLKGLEARCNGNASAKRHSRRGRQAAGPPVHDPNVAATMRANGPPLTFIIMKPTSAASPPDMELVAA